MRARYWTTISRDVTRPSSSAVRISAIVVSTTVKDRPGAGACAEIATVAMTMDAAIRFPFLEDIPSRPLCLCFRVLRELELCDHVAVYFVGTVGEPNRSRVGPRGGEREIVAHPRGAVGLNRAIDHAERHA